MRKERPPLGSTERKSFLLKKTRPKSGRCSNIPVRGAHLKISTDPRKTGREPENQKNRKRKNLEIDEHRSTLHNCLIRNSLPEIQGRI